MKQRILLLSTISLLAVILFSSCSKTNKQGRYIPANAGIVLHVDGKSLNEKLSWQDIKSNPAFVKMSADTSIPAYAKAILENPENSGIDVNNDLIMFMVKDSTGGYFAVEGAVKDEAKMKQFITNAHKNSKESSKDGYTYFTDERSVIAYNKDRFIATVDVPEMKQTTILPPLSNLGNNSDSTIITSPDTSSNQLPDLRMPHEAVSTRDMSSLTASLFAVKEDASLAKNERFTDLMKTKGDIHFWMNAEYFNASEAMGGMAAMVNFNNLYKGLIITNTVSFEAGKIVSDAKYYGGKELDEIYKKYSGSDFDKTMIKNLPSKDIAGLFIFNFKPEGLRAFLKMMNLDGIANLGLAQMGFNMDDFIKANKGDILFAVSDLSSDTSNKSDAQMIFSASIADKPSFNKLIDAGKKMGGSMMAGDSSASKFAFNTNDKYFVFSNKKTAADTYLAGSANSSFDFLDKITGGPMGGYVNIQYILKSMQPKLKIQDSLAVAALNASLKVWDNAIIKGGGYSDGGLTQHWEVNLMDKNTNSLKTLNQYLGEMSLIYDKRKSERMSITDSMIKADTSRVK